MIEMKRSEMVMNFAEALNSQDLETIQMYEKAANEKDVYDT